MITIYWWQIVAAVVVMMAGVYWIVERRIAKNNETISEYLQIKDDKMKKFMGGILDNINQVNQDYEHELREKLDELMEGYKIGIVKEIVSSLEEFYGRNKENN